MSRPLVIDLYCGLGGWAEGFLSEGYRVIGFDIEAHDYGTGGYPGELVLRDVRSIHGSEFVDATIIVASPPCQAYSYRAMPWGRARSLPPPDNSLFDACFRIQREASHAAGRYIPLIVENVRGAERWVGRARWHFGSYFLWGDVPALMPIARSAIKVRTTNWSDFRETGKVTPYWRLEGLKQAKRLYFRDAHSHTRHLTNPAEHLKTDGAGIKLISPGHFEKPGSGLDWFDRGAALFASNSMKRKAASALIAKIPFPLAQHIARCFNPLPSCTPNAPPNDGER
jgi:C-5 cytosine-specific DNA methylase